MQPTFSVALRQANERDAYPHSYRRPGMELCGPHKKRLKTDGDAASSPPSPSVPAAPAAPAVPAVSEPSSDVVPPQPSSTTMTMTVAAAVTPNGLHHQQEPFRGKCLYQSRKCENERALKRNGQPHNLCEEHRAKQNQHQRKFDAKKFSRRRRNGDDAGDDATHDDDSSLSSHSSRASSAQPEGALSTVASPCATLRESDLPDGPIALPNTPSRFPPAAAGSAQPARRCPPMAMRRDVRLRHELGLMRYRGRDTLYSDIVGQPERPRVPFQPQEMVPMEGPPSERSRQLATLRPPPLQLVHQHQHLQHNANTAPYTEPAYSTAATFVPSHAYSSNELLAARALVPPTELHRPQEPMYDREEAAATRQYAAQSSAYDTYSSLPTPSGPPPSRQRIELSRISPVGGAFQALPPPLRPQPLPRLPAIATKFPPLLPSRQPFPGSSSAPAEPSSRPGAPAVAAHAAAVQHHGVARLSRSLLAMIVNTHTENTY
ncbi:hypothetical protein PINS_up007648 [Pythium insidiosum]|nr:hypothetical protein PINS_up007648 [Pythium insidiosum]